MDSIYYAKTGVNYALEGILLNPKPTTDNRELLSYGSYKP